MKKLILITVMAFLALSISTDCQAQKSKKRDVVTFDAVIDCGSCQVKIEKAIPFVKGVRDVTVSMQKSEVVVTYDPRKVTPEVIADEIRKAGVEVKGIKPKKEEA